MVSDLAARFAALFGIGADSNVATYSTRVAAICREKTCRRLDDKINATLRGVPLLLSVGNQNKGISAASALPVVSELPKNAGRFIAVAAFRLGCLAVTALSRAP